MGLGKYFEKINERKLENLRNENTRLGKDHPIEVSRARKAERVVKPEEENIPRGPLKPSKLQAKLIEKYRKLKGLDKDSGKKGQKSIQRQVAVRSLRPDKLTPLQKIDNLNYERRRLKKGYPKEWSEEERLARILELDSQLGPDRATRRIKPRANKARSRH